MINIKTICFGCLFLTGFSTFQLVAQVSPEPDTAGGRIEILNADELSFIKKDEESIKKLVGNVHLLQDSTEFFCDSAYQYEVSKMLEAFGNIRIIMNDSLELRGRRLSYNSNTRIAIVTQNVSLTDGATRLTTQNLTYYRNEGYGSYSKGGKLVDSVNTLTSIKGYYYPGNKQASFKEMVVLVNPDYTLKTDTLGYNTESRIATFLAPTEIISKKGTMLASKGYYDSKNKYLSLTSRATMRDSSYTLSSDTLYYDDSTLIGVARGKVVIEQNDSTLTIIGDKAIFNRNTNESTVYDFPVAIQRFDEDTLFMFADTLYTIEDSMKRRTFKAYHKVRFFMTDLQGKADSLVYAYNDSTIFLYEDPILWSEESQLTGDTIRIFLQNSRADSIWVGKNSFLVSKADTVGFNQVKGKELRAKFKENKLARLHVLGNGESIYYSQNEEGGFEGMNQALSQEILIYFRDNKAYKIKFIAQPEGKYYPMHEVLFKEFILEDMRWRIEEKPLRPLMDAQGLPVRLK